MNPIAVTTDIKTLLSQCPSALHSPCITYHWGTHHSCDILGFGPRVMSLSPFLGTKYSSRDDPGLLCQPVASRYIKLYHSLITDYRILAEPSPHSYLFFVQECNALLKGVLRLPLPQRHSGAGFLEYWPCSVRLNLELGCGQTWGNVHLNPNCASYKLWEPMQATEALLASVPSLYKMDIMFPNSKDCHGN